jgi:hypothetical protein
MFIFFHVPRLLHDRHSPLVVLLADAANFNQVETEETTDNATKWRIKGGGSEGLDKLNNGLVE